MNLMREEAMHLLLKMRRQNDFGLQERRLSCYETTFALTQITWVAVCHSMMPSIITNILERTIRIKEKGTFSIVNKWKIITIITTGEEGVIQTHLMTDTQVNKKRWKEKWDVRNGAKRTYFAQKMTWRRTLRNLPESETERSLRELYEYLTFWLRAFCHRLPSFWWTYLQLVLLERVCMHLCNEGWYFDLQSNRSCIFIIVFNFGDSSRLSSRLFLVLYFLSRDRILCFML